MADTLFKHCLAVYTEMLTHSSIYGGERKYVGPKTQMLQNVGVGNGWYSKVFYYLSEMGSIVEERRGSRHSQSIVRLVRTPTLDDYSTVYSGKLTSRNSLATLSKRIEVLERRMPDIDLKSYIVSLEARLAKIESPQGR